MEDHDQRFKNMIELCVREFFLLFFSKWADRFDWSKVEWLKQEAFLNPPEGERRYVDLVAKVPLLDAYRATLRGVEHYVILIHIEIESDDSVASFHPRMFDYYSWLRGKHQIPVLPVGLFLRVGFDGIGWLLYSEELWGENLVTFRYPYIGLPALPARKYVEGENLLGVALSALMNVSPEDRARLKADALQRLATSEIDAVRRHALSECVQAYLPLEGPQLSEFEHLLLTPKYREANMVGKTFYEQGRDEGRNEEQLGMVKLLLEKKFGPVDPNVWRTVETMTYDRRKQLAIDIVSANSLEQLGIGGAKQN